MRVVVQRVKNASVKVNDRIVSKIFFGLLVFVGFCVNDDEKDIDWITKKIMGLRIFNDKNYKMNFSIIDISGELLIVSQFTLLASSKRGNRPSYSLAARPENAKKLFENFIKNLKKKSGLNVACGIFGADMKVNLLNDGPVTIILDSKNRL